MAFGFFKDKSKGPLVVTCPLCEHTQQESPLAVSSYCKGCKAYLSFRKGGEIVARAESSPDPFAHRPAQPKVEIEYKAREERPISTPDTRRIEEPPPPPSEPEAAKPLAPPIEPEISPATPQPEPEVAPTPPKTPEKEASDAEPTQTTGSETAEEEELAPRYHRQSNDDQETDKHSLKKKAASERRVACFECGDSHLANALANSTQCRKCGRLISLQDQHIREAWSSRIQTRGNVVIHKKGIVLGATIQCHNLTVEGDFTGSAECSGDLTLRRHGKIIGRVVCDRLLVEKRAKVEFLNIVETNECKIDGLVTGNLSCRGRLALEKKATLTGDIKVGSLTVADGAKHSGQIQMGGF